MEKKGQEPPWVAPRSGQAEEVEKLHLLSEISLWLDSYDDIFSDFDSRPFSQRALSDDFLTEAKKASKDKASGIIELRLLVPEAKRDPHHEAMIKKRLHEHFRKHHDLLHAEIREILGKGFMFTFLGVIFMFITTIIMFSNQERTLSRSFMIILFEPAGWFLFWEGLGQIVFESKKKKPELSFYEKMSKSEITFLAY